MNLFKTNRKTKINGIILGGKSSGTTKKWYINTYYMDV